MGAFFWAGGVVLSIQGVGLNTHLCLVLWLRMGWATPPPVPIVCTVCTGWTALLLPWLKVHRQYMDQMLWSFSTGTTLISLSFAVDNLSQEENFCAMEMSIWTDGKLPAAEQSACFWAVRLGYGLVCYMVAEDGDTILITQFLFWPVK
jgi:hypothetical protein